MIKAGIVCCRKTQIKTQELKQKGYEIVDDPEE